MHSRYNYTETAVTIDKFRPLLFNFYDINYKITLVFVNVITYMYTNYKLNQ